MRLAAPLALLLVISCASPFLRGRDHYRRGLAYLHYESPDLARDHFSTADRHLALALIGGELEAPEAIAALSYRVRALIELDRHVEADTLMRSSLEGFDPQSGYNGDFVGLALLRAITLDPERGYATLVMLSSRTESWRARLHADWQRSRFLVALNTPNARAEALKLCEAHAGQLDFDELKERLSEPD